MAKDYMGGMVTGTLSGGYPSPSNAFEEEIRRFYEGKMMKQRQQLEEELRRVASAQNNFDPYSFSSPPEGKATKASEALKEAKKTIDELTELLETIKKEPLILFQIQKISKDKKSTFYKKGDTELRIAAPDKLKVGDEVLLHPKTFQIIEVLGKPPLEISPFAAQEIPTLTWDDIGGLEHAKSDMIEAIEMPHKHKELFKFYNKRPVKGIMLSGPPGCIDGEALVQIHIDRRSQKIKLKDLVERFTATSYDSPNSNRKRKYIWGKDIEVKVRCVHNGEFRLKKLVAAYPKGTKKVLKLVLDSGKELRLTPDHEVLTENGKWVRADKLKLGQTVITNGTLERGVWQDEAGYRYICRGLKHHPRFSKRKNRDRFDIPEHRLVMEASLNGMDLKEWLAIIKIGKFKKEYKFLNSKQLVHHKDENPSNNDISNLEIVNHSEHAKEHKIHGNFPVFRPKKSTVKSIQPDGEAEVFDLTVEEAHNFIANGIVVHNCGKTLLAKAAANSMAKTYGTEGSRTGFLYVKGPEILNQYVGQTEQTIRDLFYDAQRHFEEYGYPAIIFIDEADAILGARGSMGGVLSGTIVPQFLTEMDGMQASSAIVILATNRPDILDPAIVRDGRIDRKVTVTRPNRANGTKILKMALSKVPLHKTEKLDVIAEEMAENFYNASRFIRDKVALSSIVNGAMLTNAVDIAVSYALKRDIENKTKEGLLLEDCIAAIDRLQEQSHDVQHEIEMTISFKEKGQKQ